MPTDDLLSSPSSESKEVVYTINSYEDTRSAIVNKSASHDPIDYIQKARVTRAAPPKPAKDPLQFVQLKPCNLVKTAQEQVKKAETVKKVNEEKKEEPEEWQCNLDNWKSSRRKRVEHIIDRVVEVKKFELEEHDRNRRKSKTFSEMMEERGSRRLKHLPIYLEDDNDAFNDLGLDIGDSTQTETENKESSDKVLHPIEPDSNEYTYEGAIENYKTRVSRTAGCLQSGLKSHTDPQHSTIMCTPEKVNDAALQRKDEEDKVSKIDFMKCKELFEREQFGNNNENETSQKSTECVKTMTVKERLSILELCQEPNNKTNNNPRVPVNLSFTDLKNRLEVFEKEIKNVSDTTQITAKASSSSTGGCSLNGTSISSEQNKNSNSKAAKEIQISNEKPTFDHNVYAIFAQNQASGTDENENLDTDREDSGIHTTDVSCSVSQADDQNDEPEQQIDNPNSKDERSDDTYVKKSEGQVQTESEYSNDVSILDDALELAFQEIDNMEGSTQHTTVSRVTEPIYQNLNEIDEASTKNTLDQSADYVFEPYYQVPQSQEPYYEVPKTKRVPLYENFMLNSSSTYDGRDDRAHFAFDFGNKMQPPKEKPPPPPIDTVVDDECDEEIKDEKNNFERINSITRIRKEISCKRSSFLCIDNKTQEVESFSTSMASNAIPHKGRQIYDVQCADDDLMENYNTVLGGDTKMLNNRYCQDRDLFRTICPGPINDRNNTMELSFNEYDRFGRYYHHAGQSFMHNTASSGDNTPSDLELLRNDHQKEQEDANIVSSPHEVLQTKNTEHSKELRSFIQSHVPPAKPLRSSHFLQQHYNPHGEHRSSLSSIPHVDHSQQLRFTASSHSENSIDHRHRMSNNNLSMEDVSDEMRLYAASQSAEKLTGASVIDSLSMWSYKFNAPPCKPDTAVPPYPVHSNMLRQRSYTECSPQWSKRAIDHKRSQKASNDSYNRHWFVQEAEQRRIEQQQQLNAGSPSKSNRKSLPESVIQTITQRVQNLGIGMERRRQNENPTCVTRLSAAENKAKLPNSLSLPVSQNHIENDDKVLSVSGKKKCSHCSLELGRGAAMVIESLGLLYHIDCFKCCVCHARLGDGFKGTDVRVRKYKLHCQNCFSSEDGVKFSCV